MADINGVSIDITRDARRDLRPVPTDIVKMIPPKMHYSATRPISATTATVWTKVKKKRERSQTRYDTTTDISIRIFGAILNIPST